MAEDAWIIAAAQATASERSFIIIIVEDVYQPLAILSQIKIRKRISDPPDLRRNAAELGKAELSASDDLTSALLADGTSISGANRTHVGPCMDDSEMAEPGKSAARCWPNCIVDGIAPHPLLDG